MSGLQKSVLVVGNDILSDLYCIHLSNAGFHAQKASTSDDILAARDDLGCIVLYERGAIKSDILNAIRTITSGFDISTVFLTESFLPNPDIRSTFSEYNPSYLGKVPFVASGIVPIVESVSMRHQAVGETQPHRRAYDFAMYH